MRNITLNEVPAPFIVKEVQVDGIVKYDTDNAYPTRMERIIDASVTAGSSAGMLKRFLIGEGFVDVTLNDIKIGKDRYGREKTLYQLLGQIARSISYYSGFYIRLSYNGDLKTSSLKLEKFKHCRFGKMDSGDYAGKVVVYNNWDKQRANRYKKEDWSRVDVYNSLDSVIGEQIKAAGSFDEWKGQIFFWFSDDEYIYPVSLVDPVLYDADTEKQISLFKNGELRRGFFLKHIIHHTAFDNTQDADEFKEAIGKMMGGGHEYSSMVLQGEFDQDGKLKDGPTIHIQKIDQNIDDKLFANYETGVINNIRKAFHAIPQILIDYEDGKLGTTSGQALSQAAAFYNKQTIDLRKNISQSLQEVFRNWHEKVGQDFTIKPLTL